ncbi:hypothetical protein [Catellatospora tritici]|uniref:hypothetical protein n=1 Tax=Catellatospora tritici TaxID=2851566 RepID=UPI001C2DCB06|nr:hypothetical protein [Catellatospora tritici]MBV1850500.1 hypothetical protein [Catellatospora tritici]
MTSLLAAAVLALSGCGDPAGGVTAASTDGPTARPSVRPSIEATAAAPSQTAAASPAAPAALQFGPDNVRELSVTKNVKGGQANVAVVAAGTPAQLLNVGKGCVDHFRRTYKAAFCYVFGDVNRRYAVKPDLTYRT